ncbi:MAG: redoxin domain-containing protein [Nitrospirae bacterium]|nr:redoxin domain-containing protein [Nitrospirota bacterium]
MKKMTLATILLSIILLSVINLNAYGFSPWETEGLVNRKAPQFTAKNLSGENVSLSSFEGKPILLNFWATWCHYCREERPSLNSIYKEYKGRGLTIVTVSIDRSPEIVKTYLKKMPMDFIILHDNNKEASQIYGVYSVPTSFLIDRKGIIKYKFMGLREWTDSSSKKLIEGLLKE